MNGSGDLVISRARWRVARPFVVIALLGVIAGGLVAAVTGPLDLQHGSWAAAYLVLVVGVAQAVFGAGRAWLPAVETAPRPRLLLELSAWNVGSLAVLTGTVLDQVWLVVAGSVLLVGALASWAASVRTFRQEQRLVATAYLLFVAFLILSVLVGIGLSLSRSL
ncbi:hypothetical protein [Ornithinimicrobium cryptoxanthini]|uniref:Uncharacterized protein n=1 Tax=Ornithinimicrobium cryptoxanthini TaxID=2934161 RepID=A0ABY4YHQ8_9MICO|nr:hypothetical protein [Ornithinimicrobium cryptoxanthini]USQ76284.1 hypothetical protein NF557_17125 [Ornithinimicrobium cryptoxanthini]